MDTIIIKLIESAGIPGIVLAVLIYIIWQQRIISIVKASDIERLFFTHERKFVYRLINRIGIFLLTFMLIAFISFYLVNKSEILNNQLIISIANVFAFIICVCTFFMHILKSKEWVISIKKFLSRDITSKIVVAFFYFGLISYFICMLITFNYPSNQVTDINLIILVNSFVISLIFPSIIVLLMRIWLTFELTYFYFKEGDKNWYLLKPYEKEILAGDKPTEEECSIFRFIDSSELKKNDILIKKLGTT